MTPTLTHHSDIVPDIPSGSVYWVCIYLNLSDTFSVIYSDILFWHSIWHSRLRSWRSQLRSSNAHWSRELMVEDEEENKEKKEKATLIKSRDSHLACEEWWQPYLYILVYGCIRHTLVLVYQDISGIFRYITCASMCTFQYMLLYYAIFCTRDRKQLSSHHMPPWCAEDSCTLVMEDLSNLQPGCSMRKAPPAP